MNEQEQLAVVTHIIRATRAMADAGKPPPPKTDGPEFADVAGAATKAISGLFDVVKVVKADDQTSSDTVLIVGSSVHLLPAHAMHEAEDVKCMLEARINKVVRDAISEVYQKAGLL